MYSKLLIVFLVIMSGVSQEIHAQELVHLTQNQSKYDLSANLIEVFEDPTTHLTFEEIKQKKFTKATKEKINTGYSDSKFWYRLNLKNESAKRWLFLINGTLVDEIEFFEVSSDGSVRKRVSGDKFPHSSREIDSSMFGFYMYISNNETVTIYLSIKSQDTKQFTLQISDDEYFNATLRKMTFRWFFYFGMLFMMFVYNLLLYFSIRDTTYLYYVFYIASFGLMQFAIFGYGTQFIWGENVWFTNQAPTFFAGCTTLFITLFSYKFLNVKFFFPQFKRIFIFAVLCVASIVLFNLIKPQPKAQYLVAVVSLFNVSMMITIGIMVLRKGYRPARYYMIAWGVLFVAMIIFILNAIGVLHESNIKNLILPFGGIIEVVMLSFGLGNRINTIEKEKTNVQKELVEQLRTNEEVRSRIARDLHDDLGSTLSSIRILSEFAQTQTNPLKVSNLLDRITNSTQKIQENLQDIVWTTQTKDNSIDELLIRIRQFGGGVLEAKNINYQLKIETILHTILLSPNIQYDIFMIFKESIHNITKYAQAENVVVNFGLKNDLILLYIKDDGVGFDTKQEKEGNGLKNIVRRAENIKGEIEINSKIGGGTSISLSLRVPK
jgi:signal transduction histidine kinase